MRTLALIVLALCRPAYAEQTFGAEEALTHIAAIPAAVRTMLGAELDLKASGCLQQTLAEALEATSVDIGSTHLTIFIKPKLEAWCLCGVYNCPAWIYESSAVGAKRLWSTRGTDSVSVLEQKHRGFNLIRSEGGTAGHGFVELWSWNGKRYVLSSRNDWVAGQ